MADIHSLKQSLALAEAEARLLPRRRAILETIREQDTVSFDYLSRNFVGTPSSTLHYELAALQKLGLVRKLGETRGALYASSFPE